MHRSSMNSKYWLAGCRNNVSDWNDMSHCTLLFQHCYNTNTPSVKSWFFTRNTQTIFAPPSARRNFFKCAPPPLTWNLGSAPEAYPSSSIKQIYIITISSWKKKFLSPYLINTLCSRKNVQWYLFTLSVSGSRDNVSSLFIMWNNRIDVILTVLVSSAVDSGFKPL
jgi:hypothetical protein